MTIVSKDGVIVQADDGNPAEDCNCCGGGELTGCPTNCDSCSATLTVEITGSGRCDGTFELTRTGCLWELESACPNYDIQLYCTENVGVAQVWVVAVIRVSDGDRREYTNSEDPAIPCPPTGSYITGGSTTCTVS